ncbi:M14 family zinc carboxypeptidase [Micromonospora sp. NPDC051196]|uniref:M14 family zinc carboxypeptidase n=1 Tax=Micromonospora sp. NPDC051196 TaxID=3155281 RepID=UPI00343942C9
MTRPRRRHVALIAALLLAPMVAPGVANANGPFVPPGQETLNRSSILSAAEVSAEMHAMAARSKGALRIEEIGRSGRDRPLEIAFIGTGETRVWIQGRIHGNEPYGAEASLDFLKTLVSGGKHAQEVLKNISFAIIPIYNPDGFEEYRRQDSVHRIDLNRDWGVDRQIFDQINSVRASRGEAPLTERNFTNYTQYRAVESQQFWYAWADFKPHHMIDLHHQGTYYVGDDTDKMTTFSVGISLDPGMLTQSQWDTVRRMGVAAADAANKSGVVETTLYPYINIPEGVVSAAMLNGPGPRGEYANWRSNAMFFESRGGIGQKSGGYLVKQNVNGLWGIINAMSDGSLANVDADRYNELPARGATITTCIAFPNQCDF